MKRKHITLLALPLLALPLLSSCGEDRWPAYHDQTYQSLWVDSIMRARYYWAEGLPSEKSLTSSYFLDPQDFLRRILNKKDNFSSIDSVKNLTEKSQGISYEMYQSTDTISGMVSYMAQITLIEPGSPAHKAGLRRGDLILEAGGEPLDKEAAILQEGKEMELLIAAMSPDGTTMSPVGHKRIQEAMSFPRKGILALESGLGKQKDIIYICPRTLTEDAIRELESRSADLEKARKLVLDLRYCQEGDLKGLQKAASMILTRSHGGEVLSIVERQGRSGLETEEMPVLLKEETAPAPALDIRELVVVTSAKTRGEAEMLINCLRPFISLTHIGESTQGVAYSRSEFLGPEGIYLLRPVTGRVLNRFYEATYQGIGLLPEVEIHESDYPHMVHPLGSPEEILLATAIAILDE